MEEEYDLEHGSSKTLHNKDLSLEYILSIWPIVTSIAKNSSVGDMISLGRTSYTMRAVTHAFPADNTSIENSSVNQRDFLDLHIGKHQTSYWASLKSIAPFTCCSPFHKDPKSSSGSSDNVVRACKFCSRPICKACIVRSFFSDPTQSKNIFRYRTRFLCTTCWEKGNLRKDFRYPAETTTREHVWHGQSYGQRGSRCSCSASEDNWLCRGCRTLQNISGPSNSTLFDAEKSTLNMIRQNREATKQTEIRCYGLGCTNVVDQYSKDRRRICLWCSKSLPRQFGGEDRLRWEEKQFEVRAAAAASRSADIQEWARNRFRSLTMSRRDMRGTEECILLTGKDGSEHDRPIFVRHLDAINYRSFLPARCVPSPESVYQSKHGRWTYSANFLISIRQADRKGSVLPVPADTNALALCELTREGQMMLARTNAELRDVLNTNAELRNLLIPDSWFGFAAHPKDALVQYATHFVEAGLMTTEQFKNLQRYSWNSVAGAKMVRDKMFEQLNQREERPEGSPALRDPISFEYLLSLSAAQIDDHPGDAMSIQMPANHAAKQTSNTEGQPQDAQGGNSNDKEHPTTVEEDLQAMTTQQRREEDSASPVLTTAEEISMLLTSVASEAGLTPNDQLTINAEDDRLDAAKIPGTTKRSDQ